ncbi:hypothetical protein [Flavobacterium humi]|uniref:Uncharacterized protein n=1 Tax=Flavobacterium humi TaxID=2562683 RepID=A0A4Z0LBG1_9FLAO|nr:hypothetical protein [Flavobacterium humi]TGD58946.1 hypothetical protein E4635_03595 [Flavobacterium humi]
MNLKELIKFFREGGSYDSFYQSQSLNNDSEVIEIYMEKPFNIDNDLAFFEIENTKGQVEYTFNNIKYFNLFDFYYFLDAIEESNNGENSSLTNEVIAERLFHCAIYDA